MEDMKRAKKKVLMLHPDKSRMDAKYFLFYKKAYEMIYQFFTHQQKQNQNVTKEATVYRPNEDIHHETTSKKINEQIEKMENKNFQNKFNQLFEENMYQKPDETKNAWFRDEKSSYDLPQNGSNNIDRTFQQIKEKNNGLVRYRGVQNNMQTNNGTSFYDEDDDESYVSSDPFGKLKYDDLRKVHKDETVFSVSENDIHKIKTYRSVDEFNRARGQQDTNPIEQEKAQQMLNLKEQQKRELQMQREYQAKLQSQQYAEKNKSILASFLQIKNN
tara:strand:- start:612 stop:1430 length:819 start_codon:yes stop_codon:yes gene_type:complete